MFSAAKRESADVRLTIPGQPVPASRPRVTKNGTYIAPRYAQWLRDARWLARDQYRGPVITGPVQVRIQCFGARANSDVDNLIKGPLDALTGIVYADDRQVEYVSLMRIAAKAGKRVEIEVLA